MHPAPKITRLTIQNIPSKAARIGLKSASLLCCLLLSFFALLAWLPLTSQPRASAASVAQQPDCVTPPEGLVSWYRAEGNPNDQQGRNNATPFIGVTYPGGKVGLAFSFNGFNDGLNVPNSASLNPGGQLTLDAWLAPDLLTDSDTRSHTLVSKSTGADGYSLYLQRGKVRWNVGETTLTSNATIPLSVWTHVAATYDGAQLKIYLNGVLDASVAASGAIPANTLPVRIGTDQNHQNAYAGRLDELSLYNRALTAAEIQAIFAADSAGKCAPPATNTPPTITPGAPISRQQGSPGTASLIATVGDAETAPGSLTVTVTNTPLGVTVTNLVHAGNTVTATIAAGCNATVGPNLIEITVADNDGAATKANITVEVTANTPPSLGAYPATITLELGGSTTVAPATPPADNGSIVSVAVVSPGIVAFAGTLSINPATGVVTISNARPGGSFPIRVTTTDNCGLATNQMFTITVNRAASTTMLAVAPASPIVGQPVTLTAMVTPNPAGVGAPGGTVTFRDGAAVLGTATLDAQGKAVLTVPALSQGPRMLTATYEGDPSFSGSASAASTVNVLGVLSNVSAASFRGPELAAEQVVSGFGANLATGMASSTTMPLPLTLANTTVRARDSAGTERPAPLFFVSPGQVNFLMPAGTALGAATVTITNGDFISVGTAQIVPVAPSLFAANSMGRGVAAGQLVRVGSDGVSRFEPMALRDPVTGVWSALPIELGTTRVFLVLYGTGFRGRSSMANVTATIGGVSVPVQYVGAQGALAGLDQANLELLPSLAGRGAVDVVFTVDGRTANTVMINIR